MTEKHKPPLVATARWQGRGAVSRAASSGTRTSQSPQPGCCQQGRGTAGGHWELDHVQAAWGAVLSVFLMSQSLTEAMERKSCSHPMHLAVITWLSVGSILKFCPYHY